MVMMTLSHTFRSSNATAFLQDFSDMLLLKLLELAITASEDHERVRLPLPTCFKIIFTKTILRSSYFQTIFNNYKKNGDNS